MESRNTPDDIFDELGDYVRRNPVYLNQRRDAPLDFEEEIEEIVEQERRPPASRPSTPRSASSTRPGRRTS